MTKHRTGSGKQISAISVVIAGIVACSVGASIWSASGGQSRSVAVNARSSSVDAKAAAILREDQSLAAVAATRTSKPSLPPEPSLAPISDRISQITNAHQSPLPAERFTTTDAWAGQSPIPSEWYTVYAGEDINENTNVRTPAVMIYAEPTDPRADDQYFKQVGIFDLDQVGASGSLSITAVAGATVDLTLTPADASSLPADPQSSESPSEPSQELSLSQRQPSSGTPSTTGTEPETQLTFDLASEKFSTT